MEVDLGGIIQGVMTDLVNEVLVSECKVLEAETASDKIMEVEEPCTENLEQEVETKPENVLSLEAFTVKLDEEIKEIMEVDISSEDKENLRGIVTKLSRKDLEEMMLKKFVEGINSWSALGSLRAKVLSLFTLKDKLFLKHTSLNKQVIELSKAVNSVAENNARNPKPSKPTPPLRFYRSVGLQVSFDPKTNITPNKMNQWKNNGTWSSPRKTSLGSTPAPGLIPLNNNGMSTVKAVTTPAEVAKLVQSQITRPIAKKATTPTNILRQQPQQGQTQQMRNPAAQAAVNAMNAAANQTKLPNGNASVVDLTDDSKPNVTTGGSVVIGQNGMQYRILNAPGMQLVQSPTGYQFVTQSGQTRPLILAAQQQMQTINSLGQQQRAQIGKQASPLQTMVLRNVSPKNFGNSPRSIIYSNSKPMGNMGAAINRLPMNTMVSRGALNSSSVSNLSPRKFSLPPLPPPTMGNQIVSQVRKVKDVPSRPELSLQEQHEGIVLSWTLQLGTNNAEVQSYQIYACQEPLSPIAAPKLNQWKRVGDVKALPLPMACTLSQFTDENRYHFIVRGVDVYNRTGAFCEPVAIVLKKKH